MVWRCGGWDCQASERTLRLREPPLGRFGRPQEGSTKEVQSNSGKVTSTSKNRTSNKILVRNPKILRGPSEMSAVFVGVGCFFGVVFLFLFFLGDTKRCNQTKPWLTLKGEQQFSMFSSSVVGVQPLNHKKQKCT